MQHNLEKASEKLLNPDDKYMLPLGFINNTKFYPEDFLHNITLPIIVSYAMSGKQDQVVSFAKNVAKMLPNYFTFLYNIGLKEYEHYLVRIYLFIPLTNIKLLISSSDYISINVLRLHYFLIVFDSNSILFSCLSVYIQFDNQFS